MMALLTASVMKIEDEQIQYTNTMKIFFFLNEFLNEKKTLKY